MSFEQVRGFDWSSCLDLEDGRFDYGEPRYIAIGWIGDRLFTLAYTERGEVVRVISLRTASNLERKRCNEEA